MTRITERPHKKSGRFAFTAPRLAWALEGPQLVVLGDLPKVSRLKAGRWTEIVISGAAV
jgi:hypothetical protein